jgi:prophage tail gpP-like protein
MVSSNAHTTKEAMIAASEYLADCQDRYVEMEYTVQGWSQNGYVWQPDTMVKVFDDLLFPGQKNKSIPMWIRRVEFSRSRQGGTTTKLTLTLPYTHQVATLP